MSSTFFSGMPIQKPSSKVLRPPGGVTTDIFAGEMPSTPRNGKNRMASNIFSVEKDSVKNNVRQGIHRFYFIGDQPRRGQKSVDSHNRLFGQSDRPFTPAKNHMKSNIPLGHNGNLTNGKSNGHHVNGNSDTGSLSSSTSSIASSNDNYKMNGFSKTDGNPITGEGYKGAEINTSIPSLNGANQVINKNRIPPGGFSSGLW
ncbi:hypothetical protein ACFFRR_000228 [Megaselia abdita]